MPALRASATPYTIRSGSSVSCTARPSRRNSGFHARLACGASRANHSASRAAVPTGTVLLPTTSAPGAKWGSSASNAPSTWLRSAAVLSADCGVPTARKCTSASAASATEVLKRRRPVASIEVRISPSPGSKNGAVPAVSSLIRRSSVSIPLTSCPSCAIAAAWTAPRYPQPITDIRTKEPPMGTPQRVKENSVWQEVPVCGGTPHTKHLVRGFVATGPPPRPHPVVPPGAVPTSLTGLASRLQHPTAFGQVTGTAERFVSDTVPVNSHLSAIKDKHALIRAAVEDGFATASANCLEFF